LTTGFITPWIPSQLATPIDLNTHWLWDWTQSTPAGEVRHRFSWKMGEAGSVAAAQYVQARILCHILMDRLPDSAIPDLVQSILLAWEDSALRAWPQTRDTGPTRRLKTKSVKRYDRKTFPLED
jgi:hypothetical protein